MENPDDKKPGTEQGGEVKAKPGKAKSGRECKEPVRYGRKTYGVGERLPADVPAEIIDRLEELGFV
jgi:hypothetical protein